MALLDNLQGYWKLDETSGTRLDSTANNNDLTDNNSVLYGTGAMAKIVNSAAFVRANSEFLSIADASQTGLDITGDFTFSMWIYFPTLLGSGDTAGLIDKKNAYVPYLYNIGGLMHISTGINATFKHDIEWADCATENWYYLVLQYDASAGTIVAYVDLDLIGTATGLPTSINNTSDPFTIGNDQYGGYLDGYIDEVGVWNRILTTPELTTLYNSGAGLTYPFLSPSGPANLKSLDSNIKSNIKSVNTNLIANCKSYDTNV